MSASCLSPGVDAVTATLRAHVRRVIGGGYPSSGPGYLRKRKGPLARALFGVTGCPVRSAVVVRDREWVRPRVDPGRVRVPEPHVQGDQRRMPEVELRSALRARLRARGLVV